MSVATIDTDAIQKNASVLVLAGGGLPLVADVSADGHGHGALQVAEAALRGGASWLAVSSIADAIPLRTAGIRNPLLVAFVRPDEMQDVAALDVTVRGSGEGGSHRFEPGVALYGIGADTVRGKMTPTMRVSARVLITKQVEAGAGVSYGYTFHAATRSNLAMVAIGYADGLDRAAGNAGSMFLAGKQRHIVGRVAMNAAVLNMGDDHAAPGDEAVLFGGAGEPTVRSWSTAIGVSEDEVLTVFGRELPRNYR